MKHVYFVAETKGSMSSMDLRKIEDSKIECARKFFAQITSDQVKYDVVNSYGKLMELVSRNIIWHIKILKYAAQIVIRV